MLEYVCVSQQLIYLYSAMLISFSA